MCCLPFFFNDQEGGQFGRKIFEYDDDDETNVGRVFSSSYFVVVVDVGGRFFVRVCFFVEEETYSHSIRCRRFINRSFVRSFIRLQQRERFFFFLAFRPPGTAEKITDARVDRLIACNAE